VMCCG